MDKNKIFKFKVNSMSYPTLLSMDLRCIENILGSKYEDVKIKQPWYTPFSMYLYVKRIKY